MTDRILILQTQDEKYKLHFNGWPIGYCDKLAAEEIAVGAEDQDYVVEWVYIEELQNA